MQKSGILLPLLAVLLIAACVPVTGPQTATQEPTPILTAVPVEPQPGGPQRGQNAYVDEIDVLILESFPVQVNVEIRGNLPDGCTGLDEVEVERNENVFMITLWTTRDPEMMCTMALVPFTEVVSLDVLGLPAGEYTVQVQDRSATFRLDVDNVPQTDH